MKPILVVFAWLLCGIWLLTIFYRPGMEGGMDGLFIHIAAGASDSGQRHASTIR